MYIIYCVRYSVSINSLRHLIHAQHLFTAGIPSILYHISPNFPGEILCVLPNYKIPIEINVLRRFHHKYLGKFH